MTVDSYEKAYDDYSIIMVKALADRLAEVIMPSDYYSSTSPPAVPHYHYYSVVAAYSELQQH